MPHRQPIKRTSIPARGRVYMIDQKARDDIEIHEARIKSLETVFSDISDINIAVKKIWRFVKWGTPIIVSAAVSAGIVNGKLGAFLHALFSQ